MKIHGLQKMTLLDFPGHVACTVFLNACDFRCPFCHNFELVDGTAPAVMDDEELFSFLKKRTGLLDGVAITGGEPCMHKGLPELLAKIKAMGYKTKLDTNGYHPEMLSKLLSEGLVDYVAMDVKNSPEKYGVTCGFPADVPMNLEPIRESIRLLMEGDTPYEFRTTVVAELHEAADFYGIGELVRGAKRHFLQSFTDRETVPYEGFHAPAPEELRKYAEILAPYVNEINIRGVD